MNASIDDALLAADDPHPVDLRHADGGSEFFLTCEHAGRAIPTRLGDLGLAASELERHIAWDIGAHGVATDLAKLLDATLVAQRYSRLVVDCNRAAHAHDYVPARSEYTDVPSNDSLSSLEVAQRTNEIYHPFHAEISRLLDERDRSERQTILVAVHSCTPRFMSEDRPWHVGVLHQPDSPLGLALVQALRDSDASLTVGDNQPYQLDDSRDYTVPVHGHARGYAHLGLEIRQDLIEDEASQREWAQRLHAALLVTLEMISD